MVLKAIVSLGAEVYRSLRVELRQSNLPTIFLRADQRLLLRMLYAKRFNNLMHLGQVREGMREWFSLSSSSDMNLDVDNEELRAQIKALQYDLEVMKQEREVNTAQHTKELRDLQTKAEVEYKRAQVVPSYTTL